MRPVIAITLATTPASSMPPACAWHVSRQNPTFSTPDADAIVDHSWSIRASWRAIAPVPPAVFSMSSGRVMLRPSMHLRQLSKPTPRSASSPTWPPWTMIAFAPIAVARSICFCSSCRLGIRTRLFVVATFSTYGAWMYRSMPAATASFFSASGPAS